MSDAHHDEHEGGHEIDQMPNGRLFNLMIGFSGLTLAACFGVVRLFDSQVESIRADRAKAGAYSRNTYQQETARVVDGYGQTELRDGDKELTLYHIPLAKAAEEVLKDEKRFKRGRVYPGWAQTSTAAAIAEVERQFERPKVLEVAPGVGGEVPVAPPEPGTAAGQAAPPIAPAGGAAPAPQAGSVPSPSGAAVPPGEPAPSGAAGDEPSAPEGAAGAPSPAGGAE